MNWHGKAYAQVSWRAEDVLDLRPRWTLERCEDELASVEKHLRDRSIEFGWEVLDDLLPRAQTATGVWI